MRKYIDLNRNFLRYNYNSLIEQNYSNHQSRYSNTTVTWEDILKNKCSVIIAEARSGKTTELQQMTFKLRAMGKQAFFCDISTLVSLNFGDAIKIEAQEEFAKWLKGTEIGYFFLDSIDEAKLKDPKNFEIALKKFTISLNSQLQRAHIIISSRPIDWQANADYDLVHSLFKPLVQESEKILSINTPEYDDNLKQDQEIKIEEGKTSNKNTIQIFQLAPLTSEQVEKYAYLMEVEDVSAFMEELEEVGVEAFVTRPQDLEEQIEFWKTNRCFGQYHKLIERDIELKLSEINENHSHHNTLSRDKIRLGAETLSAAITFTKKLAILIPDESINSTLKSIALDAKKILSKNWTNKEIKALLNLPIFDEALNGTVRFHHKTVCEYLTAAWLLSLINEGKNKRAIENLLFTEKYGIQFIIPSMRPIAAWLANWDSNICHKVININPEILLEYGDPTLLAIDSRIQLLLHFATRYRDRDYTGFNLKLSEAKRLANQELKDVIIKLLRQHRDHSAIRQLLLKIIWQGPIKECGAMTLDFALSEKMDPYTRAYAIRAIGTSGTLDEKATLSESITKNPSSWNRTHLEAAIETLFPNVITISDLLNMLRNVEKPTTYSLDNLSYQLDLLPNRLTIEQCFQLLQGIVRLLSHPPYKDDDGIGISPLSLQYRWLSGLAVNLVGKIITDKSKISDSAVLCTLSLVNTGQDLELDYTNHRVKENLKKLLDNNKQLKQALFWYEIKQGRQLNKQENIKFYWLTFRNNLSVDDADFFLEAIHNRPSFDDKLVALEILFDIYVQLSCDDQFLQKINEAIKENAQLKVILLDRLEKYNAAQLEAQKYQYPKNKYHNQEKENQKNRVQWIQALKKNPERITNLEITKFTKDIEWLYHELAHLENRRDHLTVTQWKLLEPEFGYEIAIAFRDYCVNFWRAHLPELRSQSKNPNSILLHTIIGLSGLAMESQTNPDWTKTLTPTDALHAIRYALCELNEFPTWVEPFWQIHLSDIKGTLIGEIKWELSQSNNQQLSSYLIARLRWSTKNLGETLEADIALLLEAYQGIPNLDLLVEILVIILRSNKPLTTTFYDFVKNSYKTASDDSYKALWLSALFYIDAKYAINALEEWLDRNHDPKLNETRICTVLNYILGDRRLKADNNNFMPTDTLLIFIKLVYKYVHPKDDVEHEGVYSPNARDNAVTIRSQLIESLFNIPGQKTFQALKDLSAFFQLIGLPFLKDRMLVLAEQRASQDSEYPAWEPKDIINFAEEAERFPRSEKELFDIALSRLDDLKKDIEEGDESIASLLQKVTDEPELRRAFANTLKKERRGKYTLSSEEELADQKRTDIRFHHLNITPVPVEIKIAENWTTTELLERLQNQLIGQYMRISKHGIFLLVCRGALKDKKSWSVSKKGKRLNFDQLVEWLTKESQTLLKSNPTIEYLKIIGIDLTKRKCKS